MRIDATVLGFLLGLAGVVGISLSQAETKTVEGRQQWVVPSVTRGRVHDTLIFRHCFWVGIPAGLVGAAIGRFVSQGANMGATFAGALLLATLSSGWRSDWTERFGQAGANSKASDSFLHGMVGGLFGAWCATYWAKQGLPQRLQPAGPAGVGSTPDFADASALHGRQTSGASRTDVSSRHD